MDRDQWRLVVALVRRAAASLPRPSRRFDYPDAQIVGMYLWAVAHDRPMSWACDRAHYNGVFRPRQLPSVSQFHRRVRTGRVRAILGRVHDAAGGTLVPTAIASIDGKSLPVGPVSKDPDARVGYAARGQLARGYKLHAIMTEDRRLPCWCVRPMNEHEMPVARRMLASMPTGWFGPRSVALADGNYDGHALHKDVAALGGHLVTNLRGKASHPVTLRQMGAARRELLRLDRTARPLVRMVARHRNDAEVTFSSLTSYGGGLGPLPAFVRRLPRVTRWVGAKIILYHTRLRLRRAKSRDA